MNTRPRNTGPHHRFFLAIAGLLLAAPLTWAQPVATPTPATPASTAAEQDEGETIILSPFEVDASRDIGYYAENTLAGSRLRTNVADLAASITVVTKQQMVDTGALDLNDVFLYEANTEGVGNFTMMNIDSRGAFQDQTAGFQGGAPSLPFGPATANRVRGVSSVDRARDYYPSSQRLPFDIYNTETIEINRGPNAILFGLGSPAGIVNQSSTKANVTRRRGQVELRVDDEGSYRGSFLYNQPLIQDSLAVLVAGMHDSRNFVRKPSHDVTRRAYVAATWKPFERGTLRASFEDYHNRNRRPNSITPRDFVTPWIEAGRPAYNPITRRISINGVEQPTQYQGSVVASQNALQADTGYTVAFDGNSQRPVLLIEQGREIDYYLRALPSAPATAGVQAQFAYNAPAGDYRLTKSQGPFTQANIAPPNTPGGLAFQQPGVTDRSLYDWKEINIISGNFGTEAAEIYNVEWEQEIVPDLHLQLGWYREDFEQDISYFISQQTGVTLYVDTNSHLLDGSVNPNFGRPFIEITQPDRFLHPEENETARATLAYTYDFTRNDGWSRSLGRHNIIGLLQRQDIRREQMRFRPLILGNTQLWNPLQTVANNPNIPADVWAGNTTQNAIERRFYVGSPNGQVTMDPGLYPNGVRGNTLRWFNRTLTGVTLPATTPGGPTVTGAWVNEPVTIGEELHFVSNKTKQQIDSRAIALQSYFWDDRIITTLGWRRDESKAPPPTNVIARLANGLTEPSNLDVFGPERKVAGTTTSLGVVVKPLPWLSLHYNKSDNFQVVPFDTDHFGRPLNFPEGEGEDYGFGLTLMENKLYANVNWFEASQDNQRGAFIGQIISRTQFLDDSAFRNWAAQQTGTSVNSPEVQALMQLPAEAQAAWPSQGTVPPTGSTQSVSAKGLELQVVYNPMPNWNIKLAASRQETVFTNVAPEWQAWIPQRLEVWRNATVPGAPVPSFWDAFGSQITGQNVVGGTQTVAEFYASSIEGPANTALATQGRKTPLQREWRFNAITNYSFTEGPLRNFSVGGAVRWEDEAAIGYLGIQDPDGIYRRIDVNQPVYDDEQFHVDLWASYRLDSLPWLGDRVRTKLQLNVRDALEDGRLQPIATNPLGDAVAWRIVDPRQWFLTATFDF